MGSIQTVEGLAKSGRLDPLQEAFITHDAPQREGDLIDLGGSTVWSKSPAPVQLRRANVSATAETTRAWLPRRRPDRHLVC